MVIAFFMMIGAVLGGLYFWGIDPLERFNALVGNAPAESHAAPKPPPPPSYVDFGLLIVPIIQDREVKKQAELVLRLEVLHEKKETIAQNLPRLQNAFLEDMMVFLPYQLRGGANIDEAAVRYRLNVICDKILGVGLVKNVSIEQSSVK